jgi:ABC-type lipoprotein export system ATPase subunit
MPVLRGVSLTLAAGETVAVVGPSGSGKSTLLNLIGALDAPSSGRVILSGRDLAGLGEADLARVRNRELGFVFQLHHLLPQCTVLENVLIPTLALAVSDEGGDPGERARQLLDRVGLGTRLHELPGRLSGGERQRVAVVRALINRPRLLLADEPTGSLDQDTAARLVELLVSLNRDEQVAVILVTHAPALAARMARRLLLRNGRLDPGPETR